MRAGVLAAILRVVAGLAALVSGEFSPGAGERSRYRPNAVLIGRSIRDLRRPATARFAELLDATPVSLYLLGTRVYVDVHADGMRLLDRRGSAVDTLSWVDRKACLVESGRWADDGPELGLFFVGRSTRVGRS